MTRLSKLALAALAAGFAAAGTAAAAPPNAGNAALPAAGESETATPVHHWGHRHCWPVRRMVWTYWGWRYRIVGTRCAGPYGYQFYPRYY
jgi:hypothetical protein